MALTKALFISKPTINAVFSVVNSQPEPIISESLLEQAGLSIDYAQKTIRTLVALEIIDGSSKFTSLGLRWMDRKTRCEATHEIIKSAFPEGSERFSLNSSNKDLEQWIQHATGTTKSVAGKNASAFKLLLSLCKPQQNGNDALDTETPAVTIRLPDTTKTKKLERFVEFARKNNCVIEIYPIQKNLQR